jgi:OOP family OmpA-OmpF porin
VRQKIFLLVIGITLAVASNAAFTQQSDKGWYGGISVGRSKVDIDDSFVAVAGATASSITKDEKDTGYKLYAGYQFNRNFALEGGWTDFGRFSATNTVTAPAAGSLRSTIKASGLHLDAIGILPIQSGFSLFGKIGTIYTTTKGSDTTTGAVVLLPGANPNPRRREWNLKYGIGAAYDFTNTVGVRAEYEVARKVGDVNTGEGDIGLWSIGVVVRF